jgi:hypothetical protein
MSFSIGAVLLFVLLGVPAIDKALARVARSFAASASVMSSGGAEDDGSGRTSPRSRDVFSSDPNFVKADAHFEIEMTDLGENPMAATHSISHRDGSTASAPRKSPGAARTTDGQSSALVKTGQALGASHVEATRADAHAAVALFRERETAISLAELSAKKKKKPLLALCEKKKKKAGAKKKGQRAITSCRALGFTRKALAACIFMLHPIVANTALKSVMCSRLDGVWCVLTFIVSYFSIASGSFFSLRRLYICDFLHLFPA